jgi:hypothetical protein
MPSSPPIRAKRTDDRPEQFFYPIPNRDLTEEEYQALDQDQRKLVRESGLWEVKTDAQMKPVVERAERAAEKATVAVERAAQKEAE